MLFSFSGLFLSLSSLLGMVADVVSSIVTVVVVLAAFDVQLFVLMLLLIVVVFVMSIRELKHRRF